MLRNVLTAIGLSLGICAFAGKYDDISSKLRSHGCLYADVSYLVYLPTSADPVEYSLTLTTGNLPDSLALSDYLITWQLPRGQKVSNGFASYYDGDHFRYRDGRLQEYHVSDDPAPFTSAGGGVQNNAQFVDLLPASLAARLNEMETDTNYVVTRKGNTLSGVKRVKGYDAQEFTYVFDKNTGLPEKLDFVFNPAGISEQTVTVTYNWKVAPEPCPQFTEDYLSERFSDVFTKFRESNFRAENLKGMPLTSFAFDTPDKQRITHTRGEADLRGLTLLAFIDRNVAGADNTVKMVRNVAETSPVAVTTVYVFADNYAPDDFDANTAAGAPTLIRRCGIVNYPTFLVIDSAGNIAEVIIGNSADIEAKLLQTITLLN